MLCQFHILTSIVLPQNCNVTSLSRTCSCHWNKQKISSSRVLVGVKQYSAPCENLSHWPTKKVKLGIYPKTTHWPKKRSSTLVGLNFHNFNGVAIVYDRNCAEFYGQCEFSTKWLKNVFFPEILPLPQPHIL